METICHFCEGNRCCYAGYSRADILTNLIESAQERGVTFVYAISPGLDISFSSPKDVFALKRKLDQVCIAIDNKVGEATILE